MKHGRPIKLTQLKRQLLLYDILTLSETASYGYIVSLIPALSNRKKMLQRDLKDLELAGLVSVKYDRKERAYVKTASKHPLIPHGRWCVDDRLNARRKLHISKLRRIAILMEELYTEEPPDWQKEDGVVYRNCRDVYLDLFPENDDRMMQRDLETLREIGYTVRYDRAEHCYVMWEGRYLREDLGIYEEDGEYYIDPVSLC